MRQPMEKIEIVSYSFFTWGVFFRSKKLRKRMTTETLTCWRGDDYVGALVALPRIRWDLEIGPLVVSGEIDIVNLIDCTSRFRSSSNPVIA